MTGCQWRIWWTPLGRVTLVVLGSLIAAGAAEAADPAKVTFLPGCNFTGPSLTRTPIRRIGSAQDCGQRCVDNPRCNVFVYNIKPKTCLLKEVPGPPSYTTNGTTSGVVDRGRGLSCQLVPNTAINTPGVPGYRIDNLPTADVCCSLCFAVPECTAFAFSNISTNGYRACFLKVAWDFKVRYGGNTDFWSGMLHRVPTYPPDNEALHDLKRDLYTYDEGGQVVPGVPSWAQDLLWDHCASLNFSQNFLRGFSCETEVVGGTRYKRIKTLRFDAAIVGNLHGSMAAVARVTGLTSIRLHDLNIDPLPSTVFNAMPELTSVNLNGTVFDGGFPRFDVYNKKLKYLSINNKDSATKLAGTFPVNLFSLPLQYLLLEGNALGGVLPSIPRSSPWKDNLTALDLSHNNFEGPLHFSWLRLSNVQIVDLTDNRFNGSLRHPNPGARAILRLGNNQFSGQIPPLDNCPAYSIRLHDNYFSGRMPSKLAQTQRALFLENNNINGSFPDLSNYTGLFVDLSDNQLAGDLNPAYFPPLGSIKLHNNLLTGVLATGLINVNYLDLSNNLLRGPLPAVLKGVYGSGLNLSYNQLEGPLPGSDFFKKISGFADLSRNNLSGPIPESLGSLGVRLDLSYNGLQGPVPASFSSFKGRRLKLDHNNLSGPIPPNLMAGVSGAYLDLSYNSFTGPPPDFFARPSNFLFVNVSNNQLNGSLPPSILNNPNFSAPFTGDFSNNQLSGSLGDTLSPYNLFLQGNYFRGPVPFRPLGAGYQLALQQNCLSGPPCSGNCTSVPQRPAMECANYVRL